MYPPTKDLCYILGVLQGDGCISQIRIRYKENIYEYYRVRLVVNSKSFADAFRLALLGIGLKARTFGGGVCPGSGTQRYETCAYSNEFFNWYITLTEEKLLKIIKAAPINISSFIRGFFDSEGTVSLYLKGRQKRLFITMYSSGIKKLKLIKSLLASHLGINAKYTLKKSMEAKEGYRSGS